MGPVRIRHRRHIWWAVRSRDRGHAQRVKWIEPGELEHVALIADSAGVIPGWAAMASGSMNFHFAVESAIFQKFADGAVAAVGLPQPLAAPTILGITGCWRLQPGELVSL